MKTRLIVISALLVAAGASSVILVSCAGKGGSQHQDSNISYYTCPMHHQIHMDHPGNCPICGMTLVPVYKGGGESPLAPTQPPSTTISPDRQQLIGLKTETATKKPAVKEIRTTGRVAFDPDLAVAQREYLDIVKNVPSLKEAARSNLKLKGMSEEEIDSLRTATGKNLYLPSINSPVWVYATLYQDEMNLVPPGSEATIALPSDAGNPFTGEVKSIDPIVNPMTRSARARIFVRATGGSPLRPDSYVDVTLKIDLGQVLTIPKSSVIDTGTRKVAFVMTDGQNFQQKEIQTGPETSDGVVVTSGITEGDRVVSSAAFLVDSEAHLKAANP